MDKTALRDAATVIVLRDRMTDPHVLMGQRGTSAAFMPNKVVFPGGAVDPDDANVRLISSLPELCAQRLREDTRRDLSHALASAAIRELWEETGLILGRKADWTGALPKDWQGFAQTGHVPRADPLQFIFRAVTPPGRPRRFDARFFLLDAGEIATDLDDFGAACDELSHLQWVPLRDVRSFDLPFITQVVLAEVAARARDTAPPVSIPYYRNDDEESLFLRLSGQDPRQSPTG